MSSPFFASGHILKNNQAHFNTGLEKELSDILSQLSPPISPAALSPMISPSLLNFPRANGSTNDIDLQQKADLVWLQEELISARIELAAAQRAAESAATVAAERQRQLDDLTTQIATLESLIKQFSECRDRELQAWLSRQQQLQQLLHIHRAAVRSLEAQVAATQYAASASTSSLRSLHNQTVIEQEAVSTAYAGGCEALTQRAALADRDTTRQQEAADQLSTVLRSALSERRSLAATAQAAIDEDARGARVLNEALARVSDSMPRVTATLDDATQYGDQLKAEALSSAASVVPHRAVTAALEGIAETTHHQAGRSASEKERAEQILREAEEARLAAERRAAIAQEFLRSLLARAHGAVDRAEGLAQQYQSHRAAIADHSARLRTAESELTAIRAAAERLVPAVSAVAQLLESVQNQPREAEAAAAQLAALGRTAQELKLRHDALRRILDQRPNLLAEGTTPSPGVVGASS